MPYNYQGNLIILIYFLGYVLQYTQLNFHILFLRRSTFYWFNGQYKFVFWLMDLEKCDRAIYSLSVFARFSADANRRKFFPNAIYTSLFIHCRGIWRAFGHNRFLFFFFFFAKGEGSSQLYQATLRNYTRV